jgi:hypothetical protein
MEALAERVVSLAVAAAVGGHLLVAPGAAVVMVEMASL